MQRLILPFRPTIYSSAELIILARRLLYHCKVMSGKNNTLQKLCAKLKEDVDLLQHKKELNRKNEFTQKVHTCHQERLQILHFIRHLAYAHSENQFDDQKREAGLLLTQLFDQHLSKPSRLGMEVVSNKVTFLIGQLNTDTFQKHITILELGRALEELDTTQKKFDATVLQRTKRKGERKKHTLKQVMGLCAESIERLLQYMSILATFDTIKMSNHVSAVNQILVEIRTMSKIREARKKYPRLLTALPNVISLPNTNAGTQTHTPPMTIVKEDRDQAINDRLISH